MAKKKKRSDYDEYTAYPEYEARMGFGALLFGAWRAALRGSAWLVKAARRATLDGIRSALQGSWAFARWVWGLTAAVFKAMMAGAGWTVSLLWRLVFGPRPQYEPECDQYGSPNYEAIRRRIGRRYRRRGRFAIHAAIFVCLNAGAWLSYWSYWPRYSSPDYSTPLAFTVVTFILLLVHGINLLVTEAEERAVEREIEQRRPAFNNRFHERQLRLAEDGELVYADEWEAGEKRKRER